MDSKSQRCKGPSLGWWKVMRVNGLGFALALSTNRFNSQQTLFLVDIFFVVGVHL